MRILMLFAALCAFFGSAAATKMHSIELVHTDSPLVSMLKQNVHPTVIEAMLLAEMGKGTVPVPLQKYMDADFYGEILFGHPGQKMKMTFDTTWIDNWVPATTCSAWSIACAMRNKYDPLRSPFSKRTDLKFNIPIGHSNLTGRVYYDLIHMNQVNVTNQAFAAVWSIPWAFVYSKFDGILGMSLGTNGVMIPIVWNLVKQKVIEKKIFSFYFNRNQITSKGGSLLFGGVDPSHFKGDITYVDVLKSIPDEWAIRVDEMSIVLPKNRSIAVCEMGCNAIMSTSGNPINGPVLEIDDFNNAIGAKKYLLGRYSVDCSTVANLPKVRILIGGRNFTLRGEDYVQKISIPHIMTVCLSSFAANFDGADKNWYFGGAFMSKYYTVFDMDEMKIGFADAQF